MKNFKLLLATATILSTGLVLNVKADCESSAYTNTVHSTLNATVGIFSPFNMTDGTIDFGDITTYGRNGNNIKIKVNPDGSIDQSVSTAQVVRNPSVTTMYLGGGRLGVDDISAYRANAEAVIAQGVGGGGIPSYTQSDIDEARAFLDTVDGTYSGLTNVTFSLVLSDPTFNLEDGVGNTCGEVSGLVPTWKLTNTEGKEIELRFGGTFTLDSEYTPSNGYDACSGSTTVTFVTLM